MWRQQNMSMTSQVQVALSNIILAILLDKDVRPCVGAENKYTDATLDTALRKPHN